MLEKKYLDKTLRFEGLYSNDPVDPGGETYKGISRKFFPNWEGWKIIDETDKSIDSIKALENNTDLQNSVVKFYNDNFYNKIHGNTLEEISLEFAWYVFDTAVNTGPKTSLKFLQNAINKTLNRNLVIDGIVGSKTLAELGNIQTSEDKEKFLCNYRSYRVLYYTNITIKKPKFLKYLKGWIKRALEI